MWKLKLDCDQYLWHHSGKIKISFRIQGPDQVTDAKIMFDEQAGVRLTRLQLDKSIGSFELAVPPTGPESPIEIPIQWLRVNDNLQDPPPPPLRVRVLSPFSHWRWYEGNENYTWLLNQDHYFPPHYKRATTSFIRGDKKVLWIHGMPGCGKTFFLLQHVQPTLKARDHLSTLVRFPLERSQILKKIAACVGKEVDEPAFRFDPELQSISNLLLGSGVRMLYVLIDNAYGAEGEMPDVIFELVLLALNPPRHLPLPCLKLIITDILSFKDRLDYLRARDPSVGEWFNSKIRDTQDAVGSLKMELWSRQSISDLVEHLTKKRLENRHQSHMYKATAGHPYLLAACLDMTRDLYDEVLPDNLQMPQLHEQGQKLMDRYRRLRFLSPEEERNFATIQPHAMQHWTNRIVGDQACLDSLVHNGLLLKDTTVPPRYHLTGAFSEVICQTSETR